MYRVLNWRRRKHEQWMMSKVIFRRASITVGIGRASDRSSTNEHFRVLRSTLHDSVKEISTVIAISRARPPGGAGGGSYPWVSWGRGIEKPEAKKQWKPWVWTTAHVLQERLLHHPLRNLHWKKLSKAESSFIIIFFSLCFVPVVGQGMTLLGGSAKCPLYTTSSITSSKCVNDPTILDEDQGRFVIAKGRSTDARWSFGGLKRWIILLSSLRIFCFLIMKYFEGFFFFFVWFIEDGVELGFWGP